MKQKNIKSILNKIQDYPAIVLKNLRNSKSSIAHKKIQFKRLSPNCGLGQLLIIIRDNPGLNRSEILYEANSSGQRADHFVIMNNGKLIEYKKGYYITDLGKKFLEYFDL